MNMDFGNVFAAVDGGENFLCEPCARKEKIDLGSPHVNTWEVGSGGWTGPIMCRDCRRSIPVVCDSDEEDAKEVKDRVQRATTCPSCGNDGRGDTPHRYLEDVVCWREVLGVSAQGLLKIASRPEVYADDGAKPRFECWKCLYEWPVPDDALEQIDWIKTGGDSAEAGDDKP